MSLAPTMSPWSVSEYQSSVGIKRPDPPTETGYMVVEQSSHPTLAPTVLWDIQSGPVRLRAARPVTVHLRVDGAYWFAENETLRVFAHGVTVEEALQDFQEHVAYFYSHYEKLRPNQVVGEGARLKQVFANSFVRG
ncbi:MAG TPA: hypothetical protein VJZ71_16640 [Phycisphaerae bacterium]|nr:hypothetical protein [Phycisphaerae bacterium]